MLRSLDTGGNRRAMLHRDGDWYARTADAGATAAVPASLQRLVEQGSRPCSGSASTASRPAWSACRCPTSTALYEVDSLRELDQTLRVLALVLTIVAAVHRRGRRRRSAGTPPGTGCAR